MNSKFTSAFFVLLLAVNFAAEDVNLNRIIRNLNMTYTDDISSDDDNDEAAVIVGITVSFVAAGVVIIMGVVCYFVGLRRAKFR